MPRPPGRPADEQHRRVAALLRSLAAATQDGRTTRHLMQVMGLDPDNSSDVRKFRRDLKGLRVSGWHIDTVKRGEDDRYVLRVIDNRIRAAFSDQQRSQLLRAAQRAGLGQLYDDLDPQRSDRTPSYGPEGLGVAQHAIRYRCVLRFVYSGRPRLLHPDDVFFAGGAWYVRGKEEGTLEDVKMFRLDRASVVVADLPGTARPARELPPPSRDPMRRQDMTPVKVVVDTSEDDLPDVVNQIGVQGYRGLEAPTGDAEVRLEVTVTNTEAFLTRMLELGTRARLVGPPAIQDRLREMLLTAAAGFRMTGYRLLVPDVCSLLELQGGRLTFTKLAGALGVPADEIRRQVQAYADLDRAELLDLVVGRRDLIVEPADPDSDNPEPSDEDTVELVVPTSEILGIEQFDATVLGPLYQAAEQLLSEEPENDVLADAAEVLRRRFLPGVLRPRYFRSRYAAALRRAIDERRKVRIVYSRAWNPGVTERVIDPYELNYSARGAEVDAGPLDEEGRIRTFLVSRIRDLDVLDETFQRPGDALTLCAAAREPTPVIGYVEHRGRWAVDLWSERLDVIRSDEAGLMFTAHLLPPVEWRCALMRIAAGPALDLNDEDLDREAALLAAQLLDHHGLRPAVP